MSERGSFATEFIYCDRCLQAARDVLVGTDKYLGGSVVGQCIVAGNVGGTHPGDEYNQFEAVADVLASRLCHPLRVAVLSENDGSRIYLIEPISVALVDQTDPDRYCIVIAVAGSIPVRVG